jgi:hypothetical protein
MGGIWWITNRREEVARAERQERLNKAAAEQSDLTEEARGEKRG